jgi:hypothetical protein
MRRPRRLVKFCQPLITKFPWTHEANIPLREKNAVTPPVNQFIRPEYASALRTSYRQTCKINPLHTARAQQSVQFPPDIRPALGTLGLQRLVLAGNNCQVRPAENIPKIKTRVPVLQTLERHFSAVAQSKHSQLIGFLRDYLLTDQEFLHPPAILGRLRLRIQRNEVTIRIAHDPLTLSRIPIAPRTMRRTRGLVQFPQPLSDLQPVATNRDFIHITPMQPECSQRPHCYSNHELIPVCPSTCK